MVKHILKNGQQLDSVAGIVLKHEDFPGIYKLIDQINERVAREHEGDNE